MLTRMGPIPQRKTTKALHPERCPRDANPSCSKGRTLLSRADPGCLRHLPYAYSRYARLSTASVRQRTQPSSLGGRPQRRTQRISLNVRTGVARRFRCRGCRCGVVGGSVSSPPTEKSNIPPRLVCAGAQIGKRGADQIEAFGFHDSCEGLWSKGVDLCARHPACNAPAPLSPRRRSCVRPASPRRRSRDGVSPCRCVREADGPRDRR